MNHNLSAIMTKASALRKTYGLTKSEALRKAWAMAKLANAESKSFLLSMKDRWNGADYAANDALNNEIRSLKASIFPSVTVTKTSDPLSSEERNRHENVMNNLAAQFGKDSDQCFNYHLNFLAFNEPKTVTCKILDENAYAAA